MSRSFLSRCFGKINVGEVINRHWATLTADEDGTATRNRDVFTFVLIPVAVAGVLAYFGVRLRGEAVNALVGAVAILAGLLFNLLALLHGVRLGSTATAEDVTFQREVLANVSYAVLFSLLTLVPLVVLANQDYKSGAFPLRAMTSVSIFCVAHLSLTLVMILKRMFTLLSVDLGNR